MDVIHNGMNSDILTVLQKIYDNPSLLKEKNLEKKQFLSCQGDPDSQGTGNNPTDQEACFALELDKAGIKFINKKDTIPEDDGSYYYYQPNGTQRNVDFLVINVKDKVKTTTSFDLKHTNGKTFYFNDGWFEDNVIYIINFTVKKCNKVYIGYGEETRTDEEHQAMLEMIEFKKSWNKSKKNIGNLKKCIRYANQYSCDGFTKEFSDEKFNSLKMSLLSNLLSNLLVSQ